MVVSKEVMEAIESAIRAGYDEAFEEGRRAGIDEAIDVLLRFFRKKEPEPTAQQEPEPEPEPEVIQLPDFPTKVCRECGRELPETVEFFRHQKLRNGVMGYIQPCRACLAKNVPDRQFGSRKHRASLAERFPKCPREDCHMRKGCQLVDKPTECESFMRLHRGEE